MSLSLHLYVTPSHEYSRIKVHLFTAICHMKSSFPFEIIHRRFIMINFKQLMKVNSEIKLVSLEEREDSY